MSPRLDTTMADALAKLSPGFVGRMLVSFISILCFWTELVQLLVVFPGLCYTSLMLACIVTGVHQALHVCLVASLYQAVTRDPGFVPQSGMGLGGGAGGAGGRDMSTVRWCSVCQCAKQNRVHHCSVCQRCVRRMDHHCSFVANCVGARNYKPFVLLLCYTAVGGGFNAWCAFLWQGWRAPPARQSAIAYDNDGVIVMTNAAVIGCIAVIITPFALFHIYLASINRTTLDALKKDAATYDMGFFSNLRSVFGRSVITWASPFHMDSDECRARTETPLLHHQGSSEQDPC